MATATDAVVEGETLTDRGWPRPYQGNVLGRDHPAIIGGGRGFPVPWVTPAEKLKQLDHERHMATIWGLLCQVCGHGHEPDDVVYAFVVQSPEGRPTDLTGRVAKAQSDAIMHERCAKLTLGTCPAMRHHRAIDEVRVVRTQARHVEVRYIHSDGVAELEPEEGVESSDDPDESNGADPCLYVDGDHCTPLTPDEFFAS